MKIAHNNTTPFKCEHPGCDFKTSQAAGLNNHSKIHRTYRKDLITIKIFCLDFLPKSYEDVSFARGFSKTNPNWMLTWLHHTKIFDQRTDVTNVPLRQINCIIWKHIENVTVIKNLNVATVIMKHTNAVNWRIIFKNTTQPVLPDIRKGSDSPCHHAILY